MSRSISRRPTAGVVAALALAAIGCVVLRGLSRREVRLGDGDRAWRLACHARFRAPRAGAHVQMALPADTAHCRVFRQDLAYADLANERVRRTASTPRELSLTTLREGEHELAARFDLLVSREARWPAPLEPPPTAPESRAEWLRPARAIQADGATVRATLDRLRADRERPGDLVQRIYEFCAYELERDGDEAPADAAAALEAGRANPWGRARAFVALCRAHKTPARLVTGLVLDEQSALRPHPWAEVWRDGAWVPYDPENDFAGSLPRRFVPLCRDGAEPVRGAGAADVETRWSLLALPAGSAPGADRAARWVDVLDLARLPLEMHEVLSLVLLLPLGALVTAVFRTVVGLRTFGTFTPALIALSFVFADWRMGLCTFALALTLGLASRALLERLKLLMAPRLGAVLTLVVLAIAFSVSLFDYFRFTPSAEAVLLPMVILTMTVERFYVTSEEDGPGYALRLLAQTALVAFCCYLVLAWSAVGRLLLAYPEIHLGTLAALVLLGRYTGYRLTELWRFRALGSP